MTKIKFCGMTNREDCEIAIDLSVDYVGFVFYNKSPRYKPAHEVRHIIEAIKGRVLTVGVFVDENDEEINEIADHCGLDFCQVYRESSLKNTITVYRVKEGSVPLKIRDEGLLLFDTYSESFGGTGKSFDLNALNGLSLNRAFIAGGISEDNVAQALKLHPYGVDLVSTIEEYPGKKDHKKMESFVNKVRTYG